MCERKQLTEVELQNARVLILTSGYGRRQELIEVGLRLLNAYEALVVEVAKLEDECRAYADDLGLI